MSGVDAPGDLIDGRYRVLRVEGVDVHAVDETTGDAVWVLPRTRGHFGDGFVHAAITETAARVVKRLAHPSFALVLALGPRVVFDAPPSDGLGRGLALSDLASCGLQALDALAHLHASDFVGVPLAPQNIRVRREGAEWRVTLVHPSPLANNAQPRPGFVRSDGVCDDLASVAAFIAHLNAPEALSWSKNWQRSDSWDQRRPFADEALESILGPWLRRSSSPQTASFWGFLTRASPQSSPRSARELAEALLPFVRDPAHWRERVAAMPRVERLSRKHDWDTLIAHGEAARDEAITELAALHAEVVRLGLPLNDTESFEQKKTLRLRFVNSPLAAAYHARACDAFHRGDRERALRDLDRAIEIDEWPAWIVTRGYCRASGGDFRGARDDYDRVLGGLPRVRQDLRGETRGWDDSELLEQLGLRPTVTKERSDPRRVKEELVIPRAYYCRAHLRLGQHDPAGALEDLDRAAAELDEIERSQRRWGTPTEEQIAALTPSREWIRRTRKAAQRRG